MKWRIALDDSTRFVCPTTIRLTARIYRIMIFNIPWQVWENYYLLYTRPEINPISEPYVFSKVGFADRMKHQSFHETILSFVVD